METHTNLRINSKTDRFSICVKIMYRWVRKARRKLLESMLHRIKFAAVLRGRKLLLLRGKLSTSGRGRWLMRGRMRKNMGRMMRFLRIIFSPGYLLSIMIIRVLSCWVRLWFRILLKGMRSRFKKFTQKHKVIRPRSTLFKNLTRRIKSLSKMI